MIRAFIAVTLDSKVIDQIAAASHQLRPEITGVRWVTPANFHLTLKFLGSIDDAAIEPIGATLREQLRLFPRFTINAKGLGVFPGPKRPRVLWVGLTGDRLVSLASRVESALRPLGFTPEGRKFTPHLTIGRWRDADRAPKSLGRQLENWQARDFGTSNVESVKLIQSMLKPEGASYNYLITVPLSAERSAQ
ncbi:MAG TPA: RNA 2',3'-cyclic phosphodiesterase [Candidatus Binatia bacterium]